MEGNYFTPPLKGFVEPGDRIDKFTLDLACGPMDTKDSLYGLAVHMVRDGKDRFSDNSESGQPTFAGGGIRTYLPRLYAALEEQNLTDSNMLLVAFATIRAENSTFEPKDEEKNRSNTTYTLDPITKKMKAHNPAFDKYHNRKGMGNLKSPDGDSFHGRGFLQLTGRENYRRYGKELALDLVNTPGLAGTESNSDKIFARWLKDREPTIRHALKRNDLAAIRRSVNGGVIGLTEFSGAMSRGRTYLHVTKPKASVAARKHAQHNR